jgi:WD40 repeat protein
LWDEASRQQTKLLKRREEPVIHAVWSPDGGRLLCTGWDGLVYILDTRTGATLHELSGHTGNVWGAAWAADGAFIVTACTDEVVQVCNPENASLIQLLTGFDTWISGLAISPDSRMLAVETASGESQLWDLETSRPIRALEVPAGGSIDGMAWSPDGRFIVSGGDRVRIWDAATGRCLRELSDDRSRSVAWSSDGSWIAAAGSSLIRVWDAETGEPVGPRILSLPDGEFATFDASTDELMWVSPGAWRWLGWSVEENGQVIRLPAETFGPLPANVTDPAAAPSQLSSRT